MKRFLVCLLLLLLCVMPALADDYEGGDPPLAPDLYLKGNPTTGYEWLYSVDDEMVLTVTDNGFTTDPSAQTMVGAGGEYNFRLDGVKEGMATVTFRYARAWETEETPLCELTYTVYVDDDLDVSIYSITANPGL